MHFRTLQHTATHCNTKHHFWSCSSISLCVAVCCSICVAVCCSMLQYVAVTSEVWCITPDFARADRCWWCQISRRVFPHTATSCNRLQQTATRCYTHQHNTTHCSTPDLARAYCCRWCRTFWKTFPFQVWPAPMCATHPTPPECNICVYTCMYIYVCIYIYIYQALPKINIWRWMCSHVRHTCSHVRHTRSHVRHTSHATWTSQHLCLYIYVCIYMYTYFDCATHAPMCATHPTPPDFYNICVRIYMYVYMCMYIYVYLF